MKKLVIGIFDSENIHKLGWRNKRFRGLFGDNNTADMLRSRNKTNKILESYGEQGVPISAMKKSDIQKMLYQSEKEQLCLRNAIEDLEQSKHVVLSLKKNGELSMRDFPVTVDYDGKALTVKTPPVFGRTDPKKKFSSADSLLAAYVRIAIDNWKLEHPKINLLFAEFCDGSELLLVVTRRVAKPHRCIADNDNFESRQVQDILCATLGISDNPDCLSLVNRIESVDDPANACTEFKIGRAKDLFAELAEKVAAQPERYPCVGRKKALLIRPRRTSFL